MARQDKSFLSRWSQRKRESERSEADPSVPVDEADLAATGNPTSATETPDAARSTDSQSDRDRASQAAELAQPRGHRQQVVPGEADAPVLPTLADVASLTRDSDYARFVSVGVDEDVKRAAMRKLFADPHFNVMDGLDIYIDDYGKPDPIPVSVLRRLNQSKFLRLFDDDEVDELNPEISTAAATPALVADASDTAADATSDAASDTADIADSAGPESLEGAPGPASTKIDSGRIDDVPSPTDPLKAAPE